METCTWARVQKMVQKHTKTGNLDPGHPGVVIFSKMVQIHGIRDSPVLSHFLDQSAYSQYPGTLKSHFFEVHLLPWAFS